MRTFMMWFTRPNGLLGLMLGLHFVLGGVYIWATPVLEAPDEGHHVGVIRHLVLTHSLPVQQVGLGTDWEQEGSQPPLYYALVASVAFWVDTSDWEVAYVRNPLVRFAPGISHNYNYSRPNLDQALHGTRLFVLVGRTVSLLLSLGTLWFTYQLAQLIFPKRPTVALLTVALVAFNPKVLFINAAVNNDNLLMPLCTLALVLSIQVAQGRSCSRYSLYLCLGLVLGAAALTKLSGLVLWPIAGLALVWVAWVKRDWRSFLEQSLLVFGVASLLAGWWFWRNIQLYGEWSGLTMMVKIAHPRPAPLGLWELIVTEWRGFFLSYWSVFGAFTVLPAGWVHIFFDVLTLLALLGIVWQWSRRPPHLRVEVVLLTLFCGATLAGVVQWTLQTLASQGRLMFGAVAPLSLFMAWGLLPYTAEAAVGIRKILQWIWPLAISAALIIISFVVPVVYLAPLYVPPPLINEASLPPNLRPLHVVFQEAIELIGYTALDVPQTPGGIQPVTLYWRALKPIDKDYVLALQLFEHNTKLVGAVDTWPGGGLAPTSQWQPGTIFGDTYYLTITTAANPPSLLRLSVSFWDFESGARLKAKDGYGNELVAITVDAGRLIPPEPPIFLPNMVVEQNFEHGIELLGLDAQVADDLQLSLYWQTQSPIPSNYTLFLYVIDAQGADVVQADAPPLAGDWPTSAWWPHFPFADERHIQLPPNLAPGHYGLRFGWYDPNSGVRLDAWQPDGTGWRDNTVILPDVFEVR